MDKKELRKNYHIAAKELLDAVSTVYDAIGIINKKRGETVVNTEDYGLPDLVKAIEEASKNTKPTTDDLIKATLLMNAVKSVLLELEQSYQEELRDLWVPWAQPDTISLEEAETQEGVQKPNQRLLSRQYHGSVWNLSGDEI